MEAPAANLLRPAARRVLSHPHPTPLKSQIRTKATSARTRRALNIPPHPSFLTPALPANTPSPTATSYHGSDTIIFNPPSSATSVYHTPFKFLPKNDPRRRANLASLFQSHFGGGPVNLDELPEVPRSTETNVITGSDRGPITKQEVEEMRALRASDPHTWGVRALSKKFNLPMGFVMACCQAPREKLEFERRKIEAMRQRWGPAKKKAEEERHKRLAMFYRGEI